LVTYGKQVYEITGETLEHTTKDGRKISLHQLRSHCAKCGALFELWIAEGSLGHGGGGDINRRCETHKRPGTKVRQHVLGSPEDQEVVFHLGR
jgi:hypothetical protein